MSEASNTILPASVWRKLIILGLVAALLYMFWLIALCFVAAGIFTLIGRPLTNLLGKIKIKGRSLPTSLTAAFITTLLFLLFATLIGVILVPIIYQMVNLAQKGPDVLQQRLNEVANQMESLLSSWGIGISVVKWILAQLHLLTEAALSAFDKSLVADLLNTLSNWLAYIGIIAFSTFMLLAEPRLGSNILLGLTPIGQRARMGVAIQSMRVVLYRYILGILLQTSIFSGIIFTTLTIAGLPQAGPIAVLGGISNLIPYVGPLFGGLVGIIISIMSTASHAPLDGILITVLIVVGSFVVAQLIDNNIAQPMIFSNMLEAHPFLIFGLVIAGSQVAGGLGMIAALPTFAVFRAWAVAFYPTSEWVTWLFPKGHVLSEAVLAKSQHAAEADAIAKY
jgi:predicted PurR-regulated permease PerM